MYFKLDFFHFEEWNNQQWPLCWMCHSFQDLPAVTKVAFNQRICCVTQFINISEMSKIHLRIADNLGRRRMTYLLIASFLRNIKGKYRPCLNSTLMPSHVHNKWHLCKIHFQKTPFEKWRSGRASVSLYSIHSTQRAPATAKIKDILSTEKTPFYSIYHSVCHVTTSI